MMKPTAPIWRPLGVAALASALLLGCSADTPESLVASAKGYLEQNDTKAAVIQLKNALQQDGESGEARLLLGQTLLKTGDPIGAAIELRKALAAKQTEDAVLPLLARAMLASGQAKDLTLQYGATTLTEPVASADFATQLALAYAAQGRQAEADRALAAALQAVPDHPPARVAEARFKAAQRDIDGAMKLVDGAIEKAPLDHEAWQLKGDLLLYGRNNPAEAIAAYRKAIALKSDFVPAHKGLLTILMADKNAEVIKEPLAAMKAAVPAHPQTRYFEAAYALRTGDLKAAKEHIDQVMRFASESVEALQLAGAIEAQRGELRPAEKHLTKALAINKDLPAARRLLAEVYVRSGQGAKALEIAKPLASGKPDANTLALLAQSYLMNGDAKKAEETFAEAARLEPGHLRSRVALALARMGKPGQLQAGLAELREVAAADTSGFADLALVSVQVRRREWPAALEAIDALAKKQPDKPLAAGLRGNVQLAMKDQAAARKSFEQAVAIDPVYFPAVARLAALDLIDKQPEAAQQRFENVLKVDPKHTQSLIALAALEQRAGAEPEVVAAKLAEAVKADPAQPGPRLLLIDQHLRRKNPQAALAVAQEAAAALPDQPDLVDALGRAHAAVGETSQAIATFNKLAGLETKSPRAHLRLADVHVQAKKPDDALQSLKRALSIDPKNLAAQRGLILLHLQGQRPKDALAVAREVQKQRPGTAAGLVLEGDIHASQKDWDAALTAYRAAMKTPRSDELAPKLHATLLAAERGAEAESFAAGWVKDRPKDLRFRNHLGQRALAKQDYAAAETQYAAVVAQQPENAVALNNLAWVLAKQGKPGALPHAEKANTLRPDQAVFIDTLAFVLGAEKQFPKAIELQKKAVGLQPENHALRLNLAKLYIEAGDKALAKGELEALAKVEAKFAGQAEVGELLKSL